MVKRFAAPGPPRPVFGKRARRYDKEQPRAILARLFTVLRVVHLTIAFLLLTASAGVPLSEHHCMGRLVNAALFAPAAGCPGHAEGTGGDAGAEKDCCDDESRLLDTIQDAELGPPDAGAPAPLAAAPGSPLLPLATLWVASGLAPAPPPAPPSHVFYRPPPRQHPPRAAFRVWRI